MFCDFINELSVLYDDRIAVVDPDQSKRWSYNDLNKRATNLSGYLIDKGVRKGDRVALIAENEIFYLDLLFACMKLGAIFVPISYRLSNKELKCIFNDFDPRLVCYTHKTKPHLPVSETSRCVCINEIELDKNNNQTLGERASILSEEEPAVIIYTSGTTGNPKGVVLTNRSIWYNAENTKVSWDINSYDSTITNLPMYHTAGLFALTVPILYSGGKIVLQKKYDAKECIDLIEKHNVTQVIMVPTMYYMLTVNKKFNAKTLSTVKCFISAGAPCPENIYKKFANYNLPFKEAYGLTEAGPNTFYISPYDNHVKKRSVGKPMALSKINILNIDGEMTEEDEVGELVISGECIFHSYWNKQAETQKTKRNGLVYTGDLATRDADGYFYIVGRKKETIISGGENIYPGEVEKVINTHPEVKESVVLGITHEKWGEEVVAGLILYNEETFTESRLSEFCKEKLASFKIPKKIFVFKDFPTTDIGKIDKSRLKNIIEEKINKQNNQARESMG